MSVDIPSLSAALGHAIWQGALVAAALALALAVIPTSRAAARHLACLVALLAINVAFVVTYATSVDAIHAGVGFHAHAVAARAAFTDGEVNAQWIVALWTLGVAVSTVRLLGGCLQLQRYRREAHALCNDAWHERLQGLAREVGITRTIELFQSPRVHGPSALGWLRPAVFVPLGWLTSLPRDQVEAVLLHELAHIQRHDLWTQWLPRVTEALFFFHPAVWWISARARDERECSCDALAVSITGAPFAYADALASMAEQRRLAVPLTLAAHGGPLMQRIQRLLQPERAPTRAILPAVLFLALAAATPLASQQTIATVTDDVIDVVSAQPPLDDPLPRMTTDTSCLACHVVSPHHTPAVGALTRNPFTSAPTDDDPTVDESGSLELTPEEWALLRRVLAKIEAKEQAQPALPKNHMTIDMQNTRCSDCHVSTTRVSPFEPSRARGGR